MSSQHMPKGSSARWAALATLGVVSAVVISAIASPRESRKKPAELAGYSQTGATAATAGVAGVCPASSCSAGDCTLTQSLNLTVDNNNQIACSLGDTTTPNGWSRCYDLVDEGGTPGADFTVSTVTFAVQQATKDGINVDVVIYQDTDAGRV